MPFGWIYGAMIFLHINQGVEQQIIRFHYGAIFWQSQSLAQNLNFSQNSTRLVISQYIRNEQQREVITEEKKLSLKRFLEN